MKKIILTTSLAIATASIIFVSCTKKTDSSTPDYSTSSESNTTQSDFDDMHKVAQNGMNSNSDLRTESGCGSATLTNDTTITIDFGTTGCVGSDLRVRTGKLIVTFTGHYTASGTVVKIKTSNYTVNGRKIQGQRKVVNQGTVGGSMTFEITDTDTSGIVNTYAKVTQTNGKVGTWRSTRTRTWTAGSSTPTDLSDDVLTITGSGNGVTSAGVAYSVTASSIVLKLSCWASYLFAPVSGTLSITAPDGTRSLNYGDGTCDDVAVYTHINGKTYTITLIGY